MLLENIDNIGNKVRYLKELKLKQDILSNTNGFSDLSITDPGGFVLCGLAQFLTAKQKADLIKTLKKDLAREIQFIEETIQQM